MASQTYTHLERSGKGGTFTYTLSVPVVFLPGVWQHRIADGMAKLGVEVSETMNTQARAAFPWEPMRSRFEPYTINQPFHYVTGIRNSDPILKWREFSSDPHWPPLAAVASWAQRHGLSAWYVAKRIAERGTQGKYALSKIAREQAPLYLRRILQVIDEAWVA